LRGFKLRQDGLEGGHCRQADVRILGTGAIDQFRRRRGAALLERVLARARTSWPFTLLRFSSAEADATHTVNIG
jgi:hypothetical protein